MKAFKPKRFQWLGPLLVMISGVLCLSNPTMSKNLKIAWLILMPIAIIMALIGVINHYKIEKHKN
jgi:hypothetical protein